MTRTRCGNCGAEQLIGGGAEGARQWFRRHRREECAVRGAASTAKRMSDAELLAKAKRLRPIPVPAAAPSGNGTTPRSTAGEPGGKTGVPRAWQGGNCFKGCIASILGVEISRVPEPAESWSEGARGWLDRYGERLVKATGYRLERLPAHACPPRNPTQAWIATISEDGPADHCVVARGAYVLFDPSRHYLGLLPMNRLRDGMLVQPTKRVVPTFSPRGSGYAVVAA
jgi:hypothetical protein